MTILLDNVSVDTTSTKTLGDGGPKIVFIRADDFGGGVVRIFIAPPSDSLERFERLKDGQFACDAEVHIDYLPPATKIRVSLVASSGAENVYVEII